MLSSSLAGLKNKFLTLQVGQLLLHTSEPVSPVGKTGDMFKRVTSLSCLFASILFVDY